MDEIVIFFGGVIIGLVLSVTATLTGTVLGLYIAEKWRREGFV